VPLVPHHDHLSHRLLVPAPLAPTRANSVIRNQSNIREIRSALGKLRLYNNSLNRHSSSSSLSTPLVPSPHSPSSAPLQSFLVPPPNEHYFTHHVHLHDSDRPPLRCCASPCQLSELRRQLRQQSWKPRESRTCAEAIPHHLHVQLP
jgi:hypothetical protein